MNNESAIQDWIDRYVYAVTRQLPHGKRKDIALELRSAIEDALDARCQGEAPRESDVLAVLEGLGTPGELARQYLPTGQQALIPSPYYQSYRFVCRIVLAAAGGGLILASLLQAFAAGPYSLMQLTGDAAGLLAALLCAFGAVTLVFALLSRGSVDLQFREEDIKNLPPAPKVKNIIPRAASVGGIILCLLFASIFLLFPRIMAFPAAGDGLVPLFDAAFLRSKWAAILLFALLGMFRECVKYVDGHYSRRVLLASITVNALSLLLAAWIFLSPGVMNPQLDHHVMFLFAGESQAASGLFLHFNGFLFGIIALAMAVDSATAVYRWRR